MFSKSFSFQKLATLILVALLCVISWRIAPVMAADETRTVALNANETMSFSDREIGQGRRLFNAACARCHVSGQTYPNPDVSLKMEDLAGATPPRDNVMAMVDYLKNPTTYDGETSLLEYHPNTQLKSDYPRLRNLTDEDLKLISAYVLVQAQTQPGWGGTKSESHSDLAGYL